MFDKSFYFQLTGLLLLFVGITVLIIYSEYEELITRRFFTISGFVVGTGVIILLGSILGFYGAISQHFYFIAGVSSIDLKIHINLMELTPDPGPNLQSQDLDSI